MIWLIHNSNLSHIETKISNLIKLAFISKLHTGFISHYEILLNKYYDPVIKYNTVDPVKG